MALVYQAEIRPSKEELVAGWLPAQPWYDGPPAPKVEKLSAFRFDDPAGAVGVETLIVSVGDGRRLQVPLTYRGEPLAGAEQWLIGTMSHSVLGDRWIYDGCGDPVYAAALATTILSAGSEAPEYVDNDGVPVQRPTVMQVRGSGSPVTSPQVTAVLRVGSGDPTVIGTDSAELSVVRVLGALASGGSVLTVSPEGGAEPLLLASCSA